MLQRGSGTIVDISSGAGVHDPRGPAGAGGWGLGYAISKGALHRVAGVFHVEMADRGIRVYNVQPGFIATERIAQDMGRFGWEASAGAPPGVVGAVVAWLATEPDAAEAWVAGVDGRSIEAQDACRDLGLLPGWPA
jgi:NAD(P)-dependent dehydrogenase (short-subunit alcohol dehydrogenase family)